MIDRWTYTVWGDVATATDADGIVTRSEYDLRRRPIREIRPSSIGNDAIASVDTHNRSGIGGGGN